jgi:hypothetical protein
MMLPCEAAILTLLLLVAVVSLVRAEGGVEVKLTPVDQDASEPVVAEARDGGVHHASHGHGDPLGSTVYGGDHGDAGIRGAIHNMDSQFLFLLSKITGLVDPLAASLASECEQSRLKTYSYGAALIAGGTKDTVADYIGNNRMPTDPLTMPDVMYGYIYNLGYGVGFGGPYLLPTYVGDCDFSCSSRDFLSVVASYSLTEGLAGQHIGEAKLTNFGTDAKLALGCIVNAAGDSKEALEVENAIDNLVEAGIQRLRLSKRLNYVR